MRQPPTMTTARAIELAGSATKLAKICGITIGAVSQWGEMIPQERAWQLKALKPTWFRQRRQSRGVAP